MSTFLITGGSGFIGSHLAETALTRGHRVIVLDDLSSGNIENLSASALTPGSSLFPKALPRQHVLAELVDRADMVFHLAATVGVFNIIESPVATIMNNIGGTEAVLKMAAKKKKKVMWPPPPKSTASAATFPFRRMATWCSGRHEIALELCGQQDRGRISGFGYWRELRVPDGGGAALQYIGPRQIGRYGMVVPRFIKQALNGQDLTVYGNGKQARCFSYVSDVVRGLLLLAPTTAPSVKSLISAIRRNHH